LSVSFVCLFVCSFFFLCVCSSKLLNHSTNFNWPQKQISSAPTMAPVDLLASGSC
jgi:YbbR domain-containing protein